MHSPTIAWMAAAPRRPGERRHADGAALLRAVEPVLPLLLTLVLGLGVAAGGAIPL